MGKILKSDGFGVTIRVSFCVMVALVTLSSCATPKYATDEEFVIALEGQGTNGFRWTYKAIPEVILIDSIETGRKLGNELWEYNQNYTLRGVKKGKYRLKFVKKRSFQPDLILKDHIKRIRVRIKGNENEGK